MLQFWQLLESCSRSCPPSPTHHHHVWACVMCQLGGAVRVTLTSCLPPKQDVCLWFPGHTKSTWCLSCIGPVLSQAFRFSVHTVWSSVHAGGILFSSCLTCFFSLSLCPDRWVQRGLSLGSSLASLLSCFRVGRCWRSPGMPFLNCRASCSSSSCAAFCRGSTTSPTSSVSSAACCSRLPSCPTSLSGHSTSTGNVSSSPSRYWPTSDCSLPSSFGFIFTQLTCTGWSIWPAYRSQASFAKNTT